jgi:hypothetical protein
VLLSFFWNLDAITRPFRIPAVSRLSDPSHRSLSPDSTPQETIGFLRCRTPIKRIAASAPSMKCSEPRARPTLSSDKNNDFDFHFEEWSPDIQRTSCHRRTFTNPSECHCRNQKLSRRPSHKKLQLYSFPKWSPYPSLRSSSPLKTSQGNEPGSTRAIYSFSNWKDLQIVLRIFFSISPTEAKSEEVQKHWIAPDLFQPWNCCNCSVDNAIPTPAKS